MTTNITHDAAAGRFETVVDGESCVLDYLLDGSVMTITHTIVPPAVGGRGIASALVSKALDTAREKGWKVIPECSYAANWLARHPEYLDLLA